MLRPPGEAVYKQLCFLLLPSLIRTGTGAALKIWVIRVIGSVDVERRTCGFTTTSLTDQDDYTVSFDSV